MAQEGNRGTLSETEGHWDNICVTLLTIATAALAAVLLVSGLGKPVNGSENLTGLTKATATGIAAGAYFILTVMVTKTVFTPSGVPPDQVAQWKKDGARNVFALFVNIALALAVGAKKNSAPAEIDPALQAPISGIRQQAPQVRGPVAPTRVFYSHSGDRQTCCTS